MIKYYKTENGYVSSIGIVEGVEVSKDEFDTEIERIQKEQEKEPVPPTIEEQILALQNALISQKISGGVYKGD